MAVALALASAVLAVALSAGRDDNATSDSVPPDSVPPASEAPDTSAGGAGTVAADPEVEPVASCPSDANRPEVLRYWQDESGMHVVVVIHTTCGSRQVVADPQARFGLFLGAEHLITGTFDLLAAAVAVPAGGTSGEIELIFDAEADENPGLRARTFLPPSEADSQRGGFDLRYEFVCTPSDEGGAASALVDSRSGAALGGSPSEAADAPAPTAPQPASEDVALAQLEQIHAADAAQRAAMTDQWVPQVTAKRLDADETVDILTGAVIVHTPSVFLNKLQAWKARYPGRAFLLRGSDFPSICGEAAGPDCLDLWIVAIAAPQPTPEDVFAGWCEAERLNYLDGARITDSTELHCIAKRYAGGPPRDNTFSG